MKIFYIDIDGNEEFVTDCPDLDEAIDNAKAHLEISCDQDEIDDDTFYTVEDTSENGEKVIKVYLIANSFGVLSDFYIEIREI